MPEFTQSTTTSNYWTSTETVYSPLPPGVAISIITASAITRTINVYEASEANPSLTPTTLLVPAQVTVAAPAPVPGVPTTLTLTTIPVKYVTATSGLSAISTPATSSTDTAKATSNSLSPSNNSTTTSTASSTTTSHTSLSVSRTPQAKRFSGGQTAGIGIACAILGGFIAFAVAWFLLLRSRRKNSGQQQLVALPTLSKGSKGLESPQSAEPFFPVQVSDILPQPLPHAVIRSEMSKLGTRIKNHATNNFYVTHTVKADSLRGETLTALGIDSKNQPKVLAMLASKEGRDTAIRYILARKVSMCIEATGNPETSFLPAAVVECMANTSPSSKGNAVSVLKSKWRVISTQIFTDAYMQSGTVHIRDAHTALATLLRPLWETGTSQQASENLKTILDHAAQFGIQLFSQPSTFEFAWEEESENMVIYPGLVQVTDDNGEILPRSRYIVEPLRN